jgi:hypothetical protein
MITKTVSQRMLKNSSDITLNLWSSFFVARNSLLLLKYKLHGGNKMSQHITVSFDYGDYMVGKWPVELSSVTDTQVQWITRLLPADTVLNTGACV